MVCYPVLKLVQRHGRTGGKVIVLNFFLVSYYQNNKQMNKHSTTEHLWNFSPKQDPQPSFCHLVFRWLVRPNQGFGYTVSGALKMQMYGIFLSELGYKVSFFFPWILGIQSIDMNEMFIFQLKWLFSWESILQIWGILLCCGAKVRYISIPCISLSHTCQALLVFITVMTTANFAWSLFFSEFNSGLWRCD